jgi:translation initiation factor IF-2
VGAYVISHAGKPVTFLDTPGHAAFSAMRSRGANVADVAILVVAADDGVQPQTKEAIQAIRSADIPFVVAINKIDKANADIEKTKSDLTQEQVLLEGWGGDTPNVQISAKKGDGVTELLELVQLVAEVSEFTGDAAAAAEGVVIETNHDTRRGVVATVLVKDGTLHIGDVLLAGSVTGKVKALEDFQGTRITEAGPSVPAVVLGLNAVPDVGDTVTAVADEKEAEAKQKAVAAQRAFEKVIAKGEPDIELPLVLRADVQGSLEAIAGELEKLANTHVAIRIVSAATGDVTESDVKQAAATNAAIVGFRVKAPNATSALAERHDIVMHFHKVIYELLDAVRDLARNRLPKQVTREDLGKLDLLGVFKYSPPTHVVGGRMLNGVARKGVLFEVLRGEGEEQEVAVRGTVTGLQRDKVPVDEVEEGEECGLLVKYARGGPMQIGDRLRFFTETVETPEL